MKTFVKSKSEDLKKEKKLERNSEWPELTNPQKEVETMVRSLFTTYFDFFRTFIFPENIQA